ncbi:unnamed protein product, partial [Ixodes persulcatus]
SPKILKVQEDSTSSMPVTPSSFRAFWMLAPWAPMASPIRSSRTLNSSTKPELECSRVLSRSDGRGRSLLTSSCLAASSVLLSRISFCLRLR